MILNGIRFGNSFYNESSENIDDIYVEEMSYDNIMEGTFNLLAESEDNFNAIMVAVGEAEVNHIYEYKQEMVYESGKISGLFDNIKKAFLKLLEKIKSIFKKANMMLDGFIKSDKEFISKYKNLIYKSNTKDFTFKGYNFTIKPLPDLSNIISEFKINNINSMSKDNIEQELSKYDDMTDKYESIRGSILQTIGGSNGKYTVSEFNKELFELFRDGESSKVSIDKVNVNEQIGYIQNTEKDKKDINKLFKDADSSIKSTIKEIEAVEKQLLKDNVGDLNDKISLVGKKIQCIKEAQNSAQIVRSAWITAIKDRSRQAKSICVKLVSYSPKNESYEYTNESSSIFDNVVMK